MKKNILIVVCFLSALLVPRMVQSQCTVNAFALSGSTYVKNITIACGQSVKIGAVADPGQYVTAYENNFNTGVIGAGWDAVPNAFLFNNPCQAAGDNNDGTPHIWFGSSTNQPRFLATVGYDVSRGGKICFDMKYAPESALGAADCEGPDLPEEGVQLEYSTDGGTSWIVIPGSYKDPAGGNVPNLVNWTNWCYNIPVDAATTSTKFRWYQAAGSGAGADHWGLDNIKILLNDPKFRYFWSHLPSFNGATPPPVSPGVTTKYVITYKDTVGNVATCKDSITVTVTNSNTVSTRAARYVICPGDTTQMITTSSFFPPDPNTCGPSTVPQGCGVGYQTTSGQIGTGNTVNGWNSGTSNMLGDFGSDDNRAQIIYRVNELKPSLAPGRTSGLISSIAFDIAVAGQTGTNASTGSIVYPNFKIFITCSSKNQFTGAAGDFVPIGSMQMVYSGNPTVTTGWNTFNFTNPYQWDGLSNIVVQICWYQSSSAQTTASKTRDHNPGFAAYQEANTNGGTQINQDQVCSGATAFVGSQSQRPNTRFTICSAAPPSTVKFEWTPTTGLDNPNIHFPISSLNTTTTYTLKAFNINFPQCAVTDTAKVTVRPIAIPTISGSAVYCDDQNVNLTVAAIPSAGVTFAWTRNGAAIAGGATLTDNTTTPGSYRYIVTASLGGCSTGGRDTIDVVINPNPANPVVTVGTACASQPATHTLAASASYTPTVAFDWTGPGAYAVTTTAPNVTRNPSVAGVYTVRARNTATGCLSLLTTTFNVATNAIPSNPVLTPISVLCPGAVVNLDATTEAKPAGTSSTTTTRYDTTFTYTYTWSGPGTINNATTRNANVASGQVGSNTYSFVYNRTTRLTQCNRNPVDGTCATAATVVAGYPITCPSNTASVTATIADLPTFSARTIKCINTDTQIEVEFDITGGNAPYTVNPAGTLSAIAGGMHYKSNPIASPITHYAFNITDSRNCTPVTTSVTRDCAVPVPSCGTTLGTVSGATQNICGPNSAGITYNTAGEDAAAGNTTQFIMHSGTLPTGTVFERRNVPTGFTFQPSMVKGTTYYITAVRGIVSGSNVDLNDACTEMSSRINVVFNDLPTATLAATPNPVCEGQIATLTFTLVGRNPFKVTYTDGTTSTVLNGAISGKKEFVTPAANTTYTITEVVDANGAGCIQTAGFAPVALAVVGSPSGGTVTHTCNATADKYDIKFAITGGNASTYTVTDTNGVAVGKIQNFGAGVDSFFSTVPFTSGTSYALILSDANKCNPKLITGFFSCVCLTEPGTMDLAPVSLCSSASTAGSIHNNDENLDGNDVLKFVLHRGNGTTLMNSVDTSNVPVFAFNPATMAYGATYYVSPVAGNPNGTGFIDLANDACAKVAAGTPVLWNAPSTASFSGDTSICKGDTAIITFTLVGTSPFTVEYSDGTTTTIVSGLITGQAIFVTPQTTTTYRLVSVADANCAGGIVSTTPVVVTINPTENANFAYPFPRYCKESTVIARPSGVRSVGSFRYTAVQAGSVLAINATSGDIIIANSDVGTYSITYTTSGPCPVSVTVPDAITIDAPAVQPTLSYSPKFCQDVLASAATSPLSYAPLGGDFTASSSKLKLGRTNGRITPATSDPGIYTITYSVNSGVNGTECPSKTITASVTIYAVPQASITPSEKDVCVGEVISLTAAPATGVDYTYTIGNDATKLLNVTTNTTKWTTSGEKSFSVSVMDKISGCSSPIVTNLVRVYAIPVPEFTASEVFPFIVDVARGYPITFNEQAQNESTYEWDMGDGTKFFSPIVNGYVYTATNANGYDVTLTVDNPGTCPRSIKKGKIFITENSKLFVPSAFSPNDDMTNDYFKPVTIGAKSYTFEVFSRWGELIYTGNDTQEGWDGFYKNAEAPDGVYIYIVNAIMYSGKPEVQHGVVTLVR